MTENLGEKTNWNGNTAYTVLPSTLCLKVVHEREYNVFRFYIRLRLFLQDNSRDRLKITQRTLQDVTGIKDHRTLTKYLTKLGSWGLVHYNYQSEYLRIFSPFKAFKSEHRNTTGIRFFSDQDPKAQLFKGITRQLDRSNIFRARKPLKIGGAVVSKPHKYFGLSLSYLGTALEYSRQRISQLKNTTAGIFTKHNYSLCDYLSTAGLKHLKNERPATGRKYKVRGLVIVRQLIDSWAWSGVEFTKRRNRMILNLNA